ncbi:MAG TPA: hypothetical protein VNW94_29160 [Streptosporangiaceae bacterium]|nr:hypothetical protein [Streptosporangiaceae bacterium]
MKESTEAGESATPTVIVSVLTPDASGSIPETGETGKEGQAGTGVGRRPRKPDRLVLRVPDEAESTAEAETTAEAESTAVAESTAEAKTTAEAKPAPDGPDGGDSETATAVKSVPPSSTATTATDPDKPGRPPAAMLAALALTGVVLLAIPIALTQLGHSGKNKGHRTVALPPGQASGGYSGFIPAPQATVPTVPTAPAAGGTPGTVRAHGGTAPGTSAAPGQGQPSGKKGGTSTNGSPKRSATYTAVAGPGCGSANGQSYSEAGRYSDGLKGWLSGSGGGCGGTFSALPMSGASSGDDPGTYAEWSFSPGAYHSCAVSVFIPNNSNIVYVGGNPAHYSIKHSNGTSFAGFHIDQVSNLGNWVPAGSVTNGQPFRVHLDNTGIDWTSRTSHAHVAAAQVKAVCS